MPRPGGPPSQRQPAAHHQPAHQQHPYAQHHQPQHQPFSPQEAHALLLDLAGAAAAATLMLVLTCWLLSLGGAFAPGHVDTHGTASTPKPTSAQH